jgi:hypothetical protein
VTQRIAVTVECDADVKAAVARFDDYVKAETLCGRLSFEHVSDGLCDLNGHDVKIAVAKL